MDPLTSIATALRSSDPAYPDKDGNITDAIIHVARALNRIASCIENHAGGDSPLHGSTLGEVQSGLGEIADAINAYANGRDK